MLKSRFLMVHRLAQRPWVAWAGRVVTLVAVGTVAVGAWALLHAFLPGWTPLMSTPLVPFGF